MSTSKPIPPHRRNALAFLAGCVVLVLVAAACASWLTSNHAPSSDASPATTPAVTSTVASSQPTAIPTWRDGALVTFHSSDPQGVGGYTEAFTVPSLWRVRWFCQPGSDETQNFLGISVQHAGDLNPADGTSPLQIDCGSQPNGTYDEHVGGSVTLQLLSGSSITSWDVYVQIPQ